MVIIAIKDVSSIRHYQTIKTHSNKNEKKKLELTLNDPKVGLHWARVRKNLRLLN